MDNFYQRLLHLLPRHIRRNYGQEMEDVFQERLQERPGARPMLWITETASMLGAAFNARIIENLRLDVRDAMRFYKRNLGFAVIAIVLLALGIGGFTSMYSMVDAWVISPLPYRDPGRLVYLSGSDTKRGWTETVTAADFADWHAVKDFESMAAWSVAEFNLTGSGDPERLRGARVSANFFRVLGVGPLMGRDFADAEDDPGAKRSVILTHELWEGRFVSDPAIVGKTIELDGEQAVVAGVLAPHFQFPLMGRTQVFTPLALSAAERANRKVNWLQVVARVAPGIPLDRARQSLALFARSLAARYPDTDGATGIYLNGLAEEIGNHQGNSVVVAIFAVTFFVLLIVCSNVGGLMLAKSVERQKEVAVRFAMGATRARVIRQFLTEHALLFVVAGAGSIAVAVACSDWIGSSIPYSNRVYLRGFGQVPVHPGAMVFAIVTAMLTGIVFGLAPALEGSSVDLMSVLKEGTGRGSPSKRGRLLLDLLVGGEIAMATMLVICNALMIKSISRIWTADVGFQSAQLLSVNVGLPPKAYRDLPKAARTLESIGESISRVPGVESAGASDSIPFGDAYASRQFWIEGRPAPPPGEVPTSRISSVSAGYFSTMAIPLISGRTITTADDERAPNVVVINDVFAKRHWPNERALGRHIRILTPDAAPAEVIGVVRSVTMYSGSTKPEAQMYVPLRQRPVRTAYFVVRGRKDPTELSAAIRTAVWSQDANVPVPEMTAMTQAIEESYTPHRVTTRMMTLFSILALALAATGLYATMARSVARRAREIGIRMALGAATRHVLSTVLKRGVIVAAIGAVAGLGGAALMAQFLTIILYDVSPWDPVTYAGVACFLLVIAVIACYLPARRAAQMDPASALRHE